MTAPTPLASTQSRFATIAPWIFVLLWSTGFIGAKYGLPYAEPFTFLLIRCVIAAVLCVVIALSLRAAWPASRADVFHSAVTGVLLHGLYLGGVFSAIHMGMPAGITAIIVGTQPIFTALIAPLVLHERLGGRQWFGLLAGFIGVSLVVGEKLQGYQALPPLALVAVLIALAGTTGGTIYQRKFCTKVPLLTGTVFQYAGASVVLLIGALFTESFHVEWTGQFILALVWLVLVLSIGAILILMYLLRTSSAARVSSLFYLVPPVTALEAFILFNEVPTALAFVGMALAAFGVWLVVAKRG